MIVLITEEASACEEKMHFKEIMTTDICKYPNTEREVDEFFAA